MGRVDKIKPSLRLYKGGTSDIHLFACHLSQWKLQQAIEHSLDHPQLFLYQCFIHQMQKLTVNITTNAFQKL